MENVVNVLIVEDNPGDAELIREYFYSVEDENYHIYWETKLSSAIKQLRSGNLIDIALVDLGLPDSNGTAAIQDILKERPHLPVVVLTGHDDERAAIEALQAGAQDYLIKGRVSSEVLRRVCQYAREREKFTRALRKSEQFLLGTLDSLAAHIAILSEAGDIVAVNKAWRDFALANNAKSVNAYADKNYLHVCMTATGEGAEDAYFFGEGIKQIIRGEKSLFEMDYDCDSPDKKRCFHGRVTPFLSEEHAGFVVVAHEDITARKLAERQNIKLQEIILHSQKMESLGTLAGGIAHDFNNILTAVLGFTEMCKIGGSSNPRLEEDLEEIYTAGIRAKKLVDQILAFSRRAEITIQPLMLHLVVNEVYKLLRASIPTSIEIRKKYSSNIPSVLADPTQIHQVIMNLCTNAVHAMQEEGGILSITLEERELKPDFVKNYPVLEPGKYVELRVSDTGCGIPPEILPSIFEPYFTTKEIGVGTGLGLAVVHGIVCDCGGDILVHSEPGKGTTFTIFLPVVSNNDSKTTEQSTESVWCGGNERILVVDDEPSILKLTKRILQNADYKVITEKSSKHALELFRSNPFSFDLVLSDVTMPEMTGDKLARQLLGIRPDLPVVLMTGYSNLIPDEALEKFGIRSLIMKPLASTTLLVKIRHIFDELKKN